MSYTTQPMTKAEIDQVLLLLEAKMNLLGNEPYIVPEFSFPISLHDGTVIHSNPIKGVKYFEPNDGPGVISISYVEVGDTGTYNVQMWLDSTEVTNPTLALAIHLIEQL